MTRIICAAAVAALGPLVAPAQEAVGDLTMTTDGGERHFVLVQDAPGPNPGSRYSRIGGDVVLTLVGVSGDRPVAPEEAAETIEIRFTATEDGAEVRTGSVVSYTTRDQDGTPSAISGTAEITLDQLTAEDDRVEASGAFAAQVPPTEEAADTEIEGTFQTTMRSSDALDL